MISNYKNLIHLLKRVFVNWPLLNNYWYVYEPRSDKSSLLLDRQRILRRVNETSGACILFQWLSEHSVTSRLYLPENENSFLGRIDIISIFEWFALKLIEETHYISHENSVGTHEKQTIPPPGSKKRCSKL